MLRHLSRKRATSCQSIFTHSWFFSFFLSLFFSFWFIYLFFVLYFRGRGSWELGRENVCHASKICIIDLTKCGSHNHMDAHCERETMHMLYVWVYKINFGWRWVRLAPRELMIFLMPSNPGKIWKLLPADTDKSCTNMRSKM